MTRRRGESTLSALLCFGLLVLAPRDQLASQGAPSGDANLVFSGTVQRLGSNVRQIEQNLPMAVVRIRSVTTAPRELGNLVGKDVTVLLKDPNVRPGQRVVVYGQTWLVSDRVAVRELERGDTLATAAAVRTRGDRLRQSGTDSALTARLASADQVLIARVISIGPVLAPTFETEHDPQWRLATIAVSGSLKGPRPAELRVAFPSSIDIMWFNAPKLTR